MKQKTKEYALTETSMVCERCYEDIARLKTFEYIDNAHHYAKCVFGSLKRIEIEEAKSSLYDEDRDFIDLYLEIFNDQKATVPEEKMWTKNTQGQDMCYFAFAKCRFNHIVGIIKD